MLSKIKKLINNYRYVVNFCKENSEQVKIIKENVLDTQKLLKNEFEILNFKVNKLEFNYNELNCNFKYSNLEFLTLDNSIKDMKLLIVGFYGAPNLGDELMLETLLLKLKNFNSNINVTIMLCENSKFDITKYPGVKILHYPKSILDLNVISDYFDCVIFGGGALLDDSDFDFYNNQLSLGNVLINLSLRMIAFNKKVILYGLSCASSINNSEYISKLNFIVENCTYISLRDENSKKVLEKIGIKTTKILTVNDIVFANQNLYFKKEKKLNASTSCNIGIIYVCSDNIAELYNFTKRIISKFCKKYKKVHISLIPFYEFNDNDTNFYKKLINKLNYEDISILKMPKDFAELTSVFENYEYIISMRYHATLIANSLGKKVLNLKYDLHRHYNNKIDYLYKRYNFQNYELLYSQMNKKISDKVFNEFINGKPSKNISDKVYRDSNEEIEYAMKFLIMEDNNEN